MKSISEEEKSGFLSVYKLPSMDLGAAKPKGKKNPKTNSSIKVRPPWKPDYAILASDLEPYKSQKLDKIWTKTSFI